MTSSFPGAAGPAAGAAWHAGEDLLASYAARTAGAVADWSVETHLTGCASCRSALSAHVDAERVAIGDAGPVRRLLRRCGVPDHVLTLLAATPSLRASWLLSVMAVPSIVDARNLLDPAAVPAHLFALEPTVDPSPRGAPAIFSLAPRGCCSHCF